MRDATDEEARKITENQEELEDATEEESVDAAASLSPRLIYEVIRRDGEHELARPTSSLIWSGVAAGLLISFSVVGEAVFRTHLPDTQSRYLIENLGYSFGFLLVILGRMQLFTENTITTVLPIMADPRPIMFARMIRLWAVVLAANVLGAFIAAAVMIFTPVIPQELLPAVAELSEHALSFAPLDAFSRGIPAGMLVAAIVWMHPQAKQAAFFMIMVFTWLIAAGDFTHIVAGSVEMAYMLLTGATGTMDALFGFFVPVLFGNIIGGTAIFALLAYGQVKEEI
ncbi:formate/nitrite transporter family protein [Sulfitobacter sp. D35]|uniref:formate/nitrite transporter family protein n=1 Tax=Sulfitobacter sp. D35 TaxID=3083252 RepID=UPI00296EE082|nr:formate/nitrite transporter family protein [Sulfitobacter sp. D35]MDW4499906.1 formate/nitrite transporter family protein [Sulfitobacter sp. D35]